MSNTGIIQRFFSELQAISNEGGWVFWALIVLAFLIAFSMLTIWSAMSWGETRVLSGQQWRRLFGNWEKEKLLVDKIRAELGETKNRGMEEIEQSLFSKARRRIPFAFVLIGTAPLVGLLGTVSGMMSTFHGMAASTANAPIETISRGISEALITTQTGLIIGVPSFVVCTFLKSRLNQCELTFQRIEAEVLKGI
ncbi:MAG: MotA/TolQ/ExbB proton channel family protein [Verrucomicrobiales bacterium]|nr:MotA/TolQ/ExbB proton channel family protein [Verrucomicrobiales bacterium]